MPNTLGSKLGRYEIRSKIGEGGMGEVYRAHDPKLGREVAIKVLPDGFAQNADRLARFEREARLLASLHHPHIAAIHGLEESGATQFLVLEFVSGITLADRLARGSIPIEETLAIARQLCEALEAAHEKGIIHRDLKPANIKITEDDQVRVLDFGLAKALQEQTPDTNLSESPTILHTGTQHGVILGTAAYMSPEQAKGKRVDKRTDIWAFGCVLFEMLTRKRAFNGETTTDILAAVIRAEPDWDLLPSETPWKMRDLLKRCLRKDLNLRLRDIGDARIEIIESHGRSEGAPVMGAPSAQSRQRVALFTFGGVVIGAVITALMFWSLWGFPSRGRTSAPTVTRFAISLPESEPLALTKFVPLAVGRRAIAISPDGTNLAYVVSRNGIAQLVLRRLDQFETKPIAGTEGAYNPFFSHDGQWIGFFADNKLKKISLTGGQPVVLCEARNPLGATWTSDDTIYFGDQEGAIVTKISAAGGSPKPIPIGANIITEIEVLPDGKWLLYSTNVSSNPDYARIIVRSIDSSQQSIVLEGGSNPHYLGSGHLLFTRGGSLLAVPFDSTSRKVTGSAVTIVEGVRYEIYGIAQFAVSNNGTLVYVPGSAGWIGKPVWVDRQGNVTPIGLPAQCYSGGFRLSPDGKRLAIGIGAATDDIWIYEFERGTFLRLTVQGVSVSPVWSPDGKRIAFSSFGKDRSAIILKSADGTGAEEEVISRTSDFPLGTESWSPDGKALSVVEWSPSDGGGISILPLEGDRKPRSFLQTPFTESFSAFSPNGRWIVYTSDESGRYEVYVRPYPGPGGKWQISTEGGEEPVWSANGEEIFYRNGEKWMVAAVHTKNDFSAQAPRLMFEKYFLNVPGLSHYPSPDGQRQVMIQPEDQNLVPRQINVVLNWLEELKQRVPAVR